MSLKDNYSQNLLNDMRGFTIEEIEEVIMIHRYLYYVEMTPILSDRSYDLFEYYAVGVCPDDSIVHDFGSSNAEDYDERIITKALQLRTELSGVQACQY